MVTIITGKMNTGKTTRMHQLFHEMAQSKEQKDKGIMDFSVDGFIAVKEMDGSIVRGYKAHQLSTGYELDMIIREDYLKGDESVAYRLGPYCFLAQAFKWMDACIKDLIGFGAKAIFLDEVGQLELSGGGYDKSIRKVLQSRSHLFISVREDLIPAITEHYHIKKYQILGD